MEQVTVKRNYHYHPCVAVDAAALTILKFDHLLKPGHHHYDFWYNEFPKKLRTPLADQPAATGWGLIIQERWDFVVLLSGMLALMVIIGVGVVLYAILKHDQSLAFGFGAYAVAVVTLLVTLKYWQWQENSG